jgi:hypothetical protein
VIFVILVIFVPLPSARLSRTVMNSLRVAASD